jgi:hypothetical protein
MASYVFMLDFKGVYITVSPEGEETEHTGLSMYLGAQSGPTPEAAFARLFDKHDLGTNLPEVKEGVYYFEVTGKPGDVNFSKMERIRTQREEKEAEQEKPKCEWCGEDVSEKGAARFSHLQKHVRQLVRKKALTKQQELEIRSVELSDEIRPIFENNFRRKR